MCISMAGCSIRLRIGGSESTIEKGACQALAWSILSIVSQSPPRTAVNFSVSLSDEFTWLARF